MRANFLVNGAGGSGVAGPWDAGNGVLQTGKSFAAGYFFCRGQPKLGKRLMIGTGA